MLISEIFHACPIINTTQQQAQQYHEDISQPMLFIFDSHRGSGSYYEQACGSGNIPAFICVIKYIKYRILFIV